MRPPEWLDAVAIKRQTDTPDNATGYAMHGSRSHDAVVRVYDGRWQRHRDARARWRV